MVETIIPLHFGGDGLAGVEYGPVIATSERFSDLLKAFSCHLSAQIHSHHSWKRDMCRTSLAGHIRDAKVVTFGNTALDQLDRDNRLGFLLDEILQQLFDLCRSNVAVMQGSPSRNAVESPLQATDIRLDPLRNKVKD